MEAWLTRAFGGRRICHLGMVAGAVVVLGGIPAIRAEEPVPSNSEASAERPASEVADNLPRLGPKRLWQLDLGPGYCPIAVDDDVSYTLHRKDQEDKVLALRKENGMAKWLLHYPAPVRKEDEVDFTNRGGASVLVVGRKLITLGFTGILYCLHTERADAEWQRDLSKEYPGEMRPRGYAESLVVHRNMLIVLVGGEEHGVIALDLQDGTTLWETGPFATGSAAPMVINVGGQDQVVFMTSTEVIGLEADSGRVIWRHPHGNPFKNQPATLIWWDDGLLLVSSPTVGGSRMLRLTRKDEKTNVEELWRNGRMNLYRPSVLRIGDYLYGSTGMRKEAAFVAVNAKTGKVAWREAGFPGANCVQVEGKVLALDEYGLLTSMSLSPEKMTAHAQVRFLPPFSPVVTTLSGKVLLLRYEQKLMAFELGTEPW